jgi:S-adenosylmethionine-diacylglycerol 3-amino-3-carboxypropyl transferase
MSDVYFNALNYSMGNEDTSFDYYVSNSVKAKNIISVCGSGSRALPLINDSVESLHIVDLAPQQLAIAKLREQIIKTCDYNEFLGFWGYATSQPNMEVKKRKELFLNCDLPKEDRDYLKHTFEKNNWESILYIGGWESTFISFSKIIRLVFGSKNIQKIFSFDDIEKQRDYMQDGFPWRRWNLLVKILGNKAMFNALLYKGNFIQKNIDEGYYEYYSKAFNHLFSHDLTKTSFFLQLCFFGKIEFEEGLLFEAKKENFERVKKNISNVDITYANTNIVEYIKSTENIDLISISDVPSYFKGAEEKNFLQEMKPSLSKKAIIINRNYLRIPDADRSGYIDRLSRYGEANDNEKMQMYRIEVLELEN